MLIKCFQAFIFCDLILVICIITVLGSYFAVPICVVLISYVSVVLLVTDELFSPLSGNANLSRNSYEDAAVNSNGPSPAVLSRLSEAGFTEEEVKLYGTHDVTNSFCDINVVSGLIIFVVYIRTDTQELSVETH